MQGKAHVALTLNVWGGAAWQGACNRIAKLTRSQSQCALHSEGQAGSCTGQHRGYIRGYIRGVGPGALQSMDELLLHPKPALRRCRLPLHAHEGAVGWVVGAAGMAWAVARACKQQQPGPLSL